MAPKCTGFGKQLSSARPAAKRPSRVGRRPGQSLGWVRWAATLSALGAVSTFAPTTRAQSYGITVESVSDYGGPNLPNADPDCQNFLSKITNDSYWSEKTSWEDPSVYDSDFVDSDENSNGADLYNFDQPGTGIAMFCGHGTADDGFPTNVQYCYHNSDCVSPPSWATLPGVCRTWPSYDYGKCAYRSGRYIVTHGAYSPFGNWVNYSSGIVKFGESPQSGNWAGAGTNGGANMVVLDLSNGVEPEQFLANLGPAMAGAHILATIMPTGGDTASVADRGEQFASKFYDNEWGSVAQAWVTTLNDLGSEGSACVSAQYGGYGGINGCGCYLAFSLDSNSTTAPWHLTTESWEDLPGDYNDATGSGWYEYTWVCNFDAHTYPWYLK